jgi:hypothetical protein
MAQDRAPWPIKPGSQIWPLISRFAPRARFVTLRQTFVRLPLPGVEDEQWDVFSPEFETGLGFNPDGARGPFPLGYGAPQKRRRAGGTSS